MYFSVSRTSRSTGTSKGTLAHIGYSTRAVHWPSKGLLVPRSGTSAFGRLSSVVSPKPNVVWRRDLSTIHCHGTGQNHPVGAVEFSMCQACQVSQKSGPLSCLRNGNRDSPFPLQSTVVQYSMAVRSGQAVGQSGKVVPEFCQKYLSEGAGKRPVPISRPSALRWLQHSWTGTITSKGR